jgi:hypothetical protein
MNTISIALGSFAIGAALWVALGIVLINRMLDSADASDE